MEVTDIQFGCAEHQVLERRKLLKGAASLALGALGFSSALSQVSLNKQEKQGKVLVVLFLRGGMDGMHAVPPIADDNYHRARPSLALDKKDGVIKLDDYFGLHPKLAALQDPFREGQLAIVHGVGSQDHTRSHFSAMSAMERGVENSDSVDHSGWIARYLQANPKLESPLRALAISPTLPDSLRGGPGALAIDQLADYQLNDTFFNLSTLTNLYANGNDTLTQAGRNTVSVLKTLARLDPKTYQPGHGATYDASDLGRAMREVAFLVKANVGLEVAVLEETGWDYHVAQGGSTGPMGSHLETLANALAALRQDLGLEMSRVTVLVQTEFGRRLHENQELGTDHGRASAMFLMGGNVKGGKVYAKWPGLRPEDLEDPGDLKVTIDYRDVLSEAIHWLEPKVAPQQLFAGYTPQPIGFLI